MSSSQQSPTDTSSSSPSSLPALPPLPSFFSDNNDLYESTFLHGNAGQDRAVATLLSHLDSLPRSPSSDPKHRSILDCGSGTGRPFALSLVRRGHRVHGIDFAPEMVARARAQVPYTSASPEPASGGYASFEYHDIRTWSPDATSPSSSSSTTTAENLPAAADAPFDAIVANLSLFNMTRPELEAMAGKWGRWLAPGGVLLLGVIGADDCAPQDAPDAPARITPDMWVGSDRRFAERIPFVFLGHTVSVNMFTCEGWRWLVREKGGLAVLETQNFSWTPPEGVRSDPEQHLYVFARKE